MNSDQRSAVKGGKWPTLLVVAALASVAATNSALEDEELTLRPPHAELPPTLWEQHGTLIVVGAIGAGVGVALLLWLWLRPKAAAVVPIEVQTQRDLEGLRQREETGHTLSQVSGAVRRYFATAFELSSGEMTTTEISSAMATNEKFNPELTTKVRGFLRSCDEQKFSPAPAPGKIGAAETGLELVRLGEERRALLRQSAAVQAANSAKQSA